MVENAELRELLAKEKSLLQKRIEAIDLLLQDTNSSDNIEKAFPSYDENLTWEDKCLFVLREKKSAYAANIIDYILVVEEKLGEDKISKGVTQALHKLKKAEKIKVVEQSGKRLRYALV